MVDQARLTRWLIQHKAELSLEICDFDWPKRMGLEVCDFEVSIKTGHLSAVGRGTDRDEVLALEKAGAEAIERFVCLAHGVSTVGVAAHVNESEASRCAEAEALERSIYDWHLETRRPFGALKMEPEVQASVAMMQECLCSFSAAASAQFCEMSAVGREAVGIVCVISDGTKPVALGMGMEMQRCQSAWKAFLEAARNFAFYCDEPAEYQESVLRDSQLWCCDPNHLRMVKELIQVAESKSVSETFHPATFEMNRLELLGLEDLSDYPAWVVQARRSGVKA